MYLTKDQINTLHSAERFAGAFGMLMGAIEARNDPKQYANDEDFRDYVSNLLVLIKNELHV
jgi:hypothetical protein